jgi:hypothetical protein
VLVNINKLKPYRFIENRTLQPILVKPSDLVIDELVQTMSMSIIKKLRHKVREEVERKIEAFRREQIEKKKNRC